MRQAWVMRIRIGFLGWLFGVILSASCGSGPAARPDAPASGRATPAQQLAAYYVEHSMLRQADQAAANISGSHEQWHGPYLTPQPESLTRQAADYLTLYPRAYLAQEGQSVLGTLADDALWDAVAALGFTLVHPITFEQAGRVVERGFSPSVDGGFDRISYEVQPELGNEDDLRRIVAAANAHQALIVGDVIPLHSGLGFDFRLAEMNVQPYPGMYELIEIPEKDWALLPPVAEPWGVTIVTRERAQALQKAGYLPGRVEVLVGSEESVSWSGWAATGAVAGVDGKTRRFVYAHLFEAEQPKYNWIDPSYAGRRSQAGDLTQHIVTRGVRLHRLDAVPFLGLEPAADGGPMQHYMTSLSIAGTNDLAYIARKLGGWTWVELNVPVEPYLEFMQHGADLGYDFFTRAETLHPLISADARVLRLAHRTLLEHGITHASLIHSLQNHDEITYQLVDLRARKRLQYGKESLTGPELADRILAEMQRSAAGTAAPYNLLYRPQHDGIATTYPGFVAAALAIDPYSASSEQIEAIKQAHLMLAHMTALQPGVFSISQWDLVGALPLDRSVVERRLAGGDVRWVNRGAVDLMGQALQTTTSDGLPRAKTLYGTLPQQLKDPKSFASQIGQLIHVRKAYGLANATVVQVPEVANDAVCVLVMTLPPDVGGVAVTAVNYGRGPSAVNVSLRDIKLAAGQLTGKPHDVISGEDVGSLQGQQLTLPVPGLSGRTVVLGAKPRS
ncbi:MAG: maltose alpha-D-glucosyltransferase [Polyangiales bacterium]